MKAKTVPVMSLWSLATVRLHRCIFTGIKNDSITARFRIFWIGRLNVEKRCGKFPQYWYFVADSGTGNVIW
jgi:hypothetical protein